MKLKEKLLSLKENILSSNLSILESHSVGEQEIYRLRYIHYSKIRGYYGRYECSYEMTDCFFKPFMLPKGMTRNEGFKVLSYLIDFIEAREELKDCALNSLKTLDKVLDLERFGFTRVDEKDEDKILDLFTVTGRISFFKKNELYKKYFEWYVENITKEEVENIYAKYGMKFSDIGFIGNENTKGYSKKLKK